MRQSDEEERNVMESPEDDGPRESGDPESAEEATSTENPGTEPEGSGARAAPHESVQMLLSAAGPDGPVTARESVTVT